MSSIKEAVEKEVGKIKKSYIDSVHRLNSDNGTAASFSKDYEGRQIYELLQNAEDQVKDGNGKVKISLNGNKLIVSNTGEPFSTKGLISILYVCDSPKEHVTAKTIGYKGIGFRSVLNWTDEIKIISNGLKLEFSKKQAEKTFNSILAQVDNREEYERDYKTTESSKIPVLVCPNITEAEKKIDGFDTVLEFTCFESAISKVREQINDLKPEVLLFLTKLKTIEFDINGEKKQFIRDSNEDNTLKTLTVDYFGAKQEETREYNFYTEHSESEDDKIQGKYYEISIGYDRKNKTSGEVLYSYFKTNVEMSFPAFIHATFELTSNRNDLLENNLYNAELTKKLVQKLSKTAVEISLLDSKDKIATYEPLKLLFTNIIHKSLICYNFEKLVKQEIQTAKLFPTIDNSYISLTERPFYSQYQFGKILSPETFNTLLKTCDNNSIQNFIINTARVPFYSQNEFKNKLNSGIETGDYTLEEKCELINLIIDSKDTHKISGKGINLLEDSDGNPISNDEVVYVQPKNDSLKFNWTWLKLKFLNTDMEAIILQEIAVDEIEKKYRDDFNLNRYRFNTLIGKIISDLRENLTEENVKAVLNWLFKFYHTPKTENEENNERDLGKQKIPVICRNNQIKNADEVYFGTDYANEIGEKIISSFNKESFLIFEDHGSHDIQEVIRFYKWLGVSLFPRIKNTSIQRDEREKYIEYCFESDQYLKSDYDWYKKKDFDCSYINSLHLAFFENFEKIIKNNDFQYLIIWFLLDENVSKALESSNELSLQSEMTYTGYRKQNLRTFKNETLSNYIRYYLTKKPWISSKNNFYSTEYCCLEELKGQSVIITPKIDIDTIKKYSPASSLAEVQGLLLKLGVSEKFADVKTEVKYELLFKLPEIDKPECKYGKSIYNKFKGTAEKINKDSRIYKEFLEKGEVLVSQNNEKKYISVKKAKYTPNKLFSEKILNEFPMFVYDYRQGKVPELFGVELLGDIHPSISNEKITPSINKDFSKTFEEFKVYLLASRLITNDADTDLRKLKNLNIILANSVTVNFPINDEERTVVLDDYKTVYLNESDEKKNKIAYIKIPTNCTSYREIENNPYFADAVAEIVTTVLDLSGELNFFSSLFAASHERRTNILINTKGEEVLEYIEKAKAKLKIIFDSKKEFWLTIANAKNIHIPDSYAVEDILDYLKIDRSLGNRINYDHLNSIDNFPQIISLFQSLKIDIEDYNKQTSDRIYLINYYQDCLKELKIKLKDKYIVYIYKKYKEKGKLTEFEDDRYNYFSVKSDFKNSAYENIEKKFEELFSVSCSELCEIKEKSIDSIIEERKKNCSEYEKLIQEYPAEKIDLYLLFDCINNLNTEGISNKKNSELPKKTTKDILAEAKKLAKNASFETDVAVEKVELTSKSVGKKNGHTFGSGKKTSNLSEVYEVNGLAGEIAVYEALRKKYKVDWLSENAVKYGLLHSGDDSLGYDMAYFNNSNERIMVEVKATTGDQIEFNLSSNEFSVALEDPEHYEIFFVFLNSDTEARILNLGKLFLFDNNETPFNNSKFSIQYDKYVIKTKERI